jgi:hypothetical protein
MTYDDAKLKELAEFLGEARRKCEALMPKPDNEPAADLDAAIKLVGSWSHSDYEYINNVYRILLAVRDNVVPYLRYENYPIAKDILAAVGVKEKP